MIEELGKFIKVKNMIDHSLSPVPNQFIITTDEGTIFQSYETIIAAKIGGVIFLDENKWDYSTTTGKYRNLFLGEDKKETERKIKSGEYRLCDLNNQGE